MKKLLSWILVAAFFTALCAPALAAHPEGSLYRGIKGHREEVEFLQYQLFYAGYLDDVSEVDGVFGKKTEEALKKWQRDAGYPANGVADPDVLAALQQQWDDAMEPQGGGEEEDYVPLYCRWPGEFGVTELTMCERHRTLFARADGMLKAAKTDEEGRQARQAVVTLWLEEVGELYSDWIAIDPGREAEVLRIHETYTAYFRANQAAWHSLYGEGSVKALDPAIDMLSDQCVALCCMLGRTY